MKKTGIINAPLSAVVAKLGHMDMMLACQFQMVCCASTWL